MFFWDPSYIMVLPALILAIWAQFKVKSTFSKYSNVIAANGKPAHQIAREILSAYGLSYVRVEQVEGSLTDHYDPKDKVLRLSEDVYDSPSIAAIGVAAHEAGHAIQHAKKYNPLIVRNAIVPAVNIGSWAAFPLFIIGFIFHSPVMVQIGIVFFTGVVIFQLITLPVEFNASNRALAILKSGYFGQKEYQGAKKVLNAAAMTYVASALMSLLELVRLIFQASGMRSDD